MKQGSHVHESGLHRLGEDGNDDSSLVMHSSVTKEVMTEQTITRTTADHENPDTTESEVLMNISTNNPHSYEPTPISAVDTEPELHSESTAIMPQNEVMSLSEIQPKYQDKWNAMDDMVSEEHDNHIPSEMYVGPTYSIRLHRFTLALRLVQLVLIFWLLGGLSLWITIGVSIITKVCYNVLEKSYDSSMYTVTIYTGVLAFILYSVTLLRSFIRTFLRIAISIWQYKMSFDYIARSSLYYPFFKTAEIIYFIMDKIQGGLRAVKAMFRVCLPCIFRRNRKKESDDQSKDAEEEKKEIQEFIHKLAHIFIAITVGTILGAPMVIIGGMYGYWILISFMTMIVCVAAAAIILIVNLVSRIIRCMMFISSLQYMDQISEPLPFLRASLMAFAGYDNGQDVVRQVCVRWILLFILSLFKGSRYGLDVFYLSGGFVLSILYLFGFFNRRIQSAYLAVSPERKVYTGEARWPLGFAIFTDTWITANGLAFLGTYDKDHIGSTQYSYLALLWVFSSLFIIRMLSVLIVFGSCAKSTFSLRQRFLIYVVCSVMMMILAICFRIWTRGFSAALTVIIAYTTFDFRQPKAMWTIYGAQRRKKDAWKKRSYATIKSIVQLGLFFALVAFGLAYFSSSSKWFPGRPSVDESFMKMRQVNSTGIMNPLCSLKVRNLSIAHYSELANIVYEHYPFGFRDNDWTKHFNISGPLKEFDAKEGMFGRNDGGPQPGYVVFHARNTTGSNLTIIAVRGTATVSDVIQDLYIYSSSILLSLSSYFGTLTQVWPVEYVAELYDFIQRLAGESDSASGLTYAEQIISVAETFIGQGRDVVVTGHSLGGAVSGIVSARLNIPGIGFSAPGLGYQSKRNKFHLDGLMSNYLNIAPTHDLVVAADVQVGLIQQIPCYEGDPVACHSINRTVTVLRQMCR